MGDVIVELGYRVPCGRASDGFDGLSFRAILLVIVAPVVWWVMASSGGWEHRRYPGDLICKVSAFGSSCASCPEAERRRGWPYEHVETAASRTCSDIERRARPVAEVDGAKNVGPVGPHRSVGRQLVGDEQSRYRATRRLRSAKSIA
jgi:hypothetical protein